MVGFVPMRSEQRVEARSALKYISAPHKLYQTSSSQHSPHTPTTNMAELDRIPPSTTTYVIATAIIAGISGYFLGQGASLGLFSSKEKEGWPNSYNVKVHRGSSDEEDETEEEEESEEEEGDGSELANFENNNEEVKLVLVVRTDLGMTKGTGISFLTGARPRSMDFQALNGRYQRHEKQQLTPVRYRQNCSPVFPRNSRLLQISRRKPVQLYDPASLGATRSSEDCATDQIGGGNGVAAGASHKPWVVRSRYTRCWTHPDRQRQQDSAWSFGTEERG